MAKVKVVELSSVSKEMKARIRTVISRTWGYIKYDAMNELGIRTAAEAAEMTLDADRCETNGGDVEAAKVLYSLDYKDMVKIAKSVVKHDLY